MPELPAGQRRARAAQWSARCVPLVRQGAGPNPRTNGPGPGPGSLSKLHWGEDSCVFTASREVKMRGIATRRGRTRTRPSTASKCRSETLGMPAARHILLQKMLLYCIVKTLGSSRLCRVLFSGSLRICRSSNLPPSSRFTFEVVPPAACLLLDTFCYKKNAIVLHCKKISAQVLARRARSD